jgi:putative ubiquitin-RnfH superfamily antitoxin RatB of RatAB toxin-antitoxin module
MANKLQIAVTLVVSPAERDIREVALTLHAGSTVAVALQASGLLNGLAPEQADALTVAIWSRKVALSHVLRDQDRIELCRTLKVDPKVARRERFVSQGAKSAGLFSKRRQGAKAGY